MTKELKTLFIVGPDTTITKEIKELLNRDDCLIIGDGKKDVSMELIRQDLKDQGYVVTKNTYIGISAHGLRDSKNKDKQHSIQLREGFKKDTNEFLKIYKTNLNVLYMLTYGAVTEDPLINIRIH